ncbi:putative nucleotidyltransferase substrate binding domain-containing protein [Photobacterium rosenbergii]|uniref:putative nucleotidyltransferase substrate binding domain-containing protein n=1 Tax=Photobacterium rosenbergii TaxID=294936 RepID=UPI001C9A05ED|nr:putative nucleotidyltransferase substrate binding domain-containing protein [Photobacterium rosenbergii]MBY5948541.1 cyclic nucleotide-binding domain-containing protein [Photobacterium rosenbergii]
MSDSFDTSLPPFDRLSSEQQQRLVDSLDVAYYRHGDILVEAGKPSEQLHIIIKGSVEESAADGSEIYAHYTSDDLFDVRSQLEPSCRHRYTALEDTLCYLVPKPLFLDLYYGNSQFAAYFDTSLARRQELLEEAQRQQNLAEFILTRVDSSNIQPCLILPRSCDLHAATVKLQQQGMDAALVEAGDEQPYGIITRTNLLHAVMLDNLPASTAIGEVATSPVISVSKGDYLFNAMLAMTRHKVKRVSVTDGAELVGMLDLTQVLSLFSTHSHVLTLRIARATTVEELSLAASSQSRLVATLFNNGIHTRFVMELIAAVNEQIIEKAFRLVVPQALQNHCCLVVMGSEGRGEQILKTDQDNALIIEDGVEWPGLGDTMETLTHTLHQLGYPLCPGKVMVNNPKWVKHQSEWLQTLKDFARKGTENEMMDLAILADSHAVAGNPELLRPIKQQLHQQMAEQELLMTTFTRPALRFSVPLSLFGKLKSGKDGLDIKRGGIFPIIHGVRALALEHGIEDNNTFTRLEQLAQRKVLESDTASNLSEALKLFIKLRLRQQLDIPAGGLQQHLNVERLNRADRDLLRHSLHVVKKFKEWLGYHYQIRD